MGEEYKNYGGLRLKSDDDGGNKSEDSGSTGSKPTAPSVNYNGFDGESLNLENNIYFQDADTASSKSNTYTPGNGMRHKVDVPNWTFILFVFLGMILIFIQLNRMQDMSKKKELIKSGNSVVADVTDVDRNYRRRSSDTYSVYVDYEIDGVQYSHVYLGRSYSYVSERETVRIYYDEKNPRNIASELTKGEKTFQLWAGWGLVALLAFFAYQAYKDPDGVSKSMLSSFTKKRNRW